MTEIRHVKPEDKEFWFSLDRHLAENQFEHNVRDAMGYVILKGHEQAMEMFLVKSI